MQYKVILNFLLILSMGYSQILWNEPPDTIFYENHSRWIEVILPRPKSFKATTINQNQVKLTLEPYWTDDFITAYTNKFGYEPIPNRYSLYKDGNALSGIPIYDTVFIDSDVVLGETYNYEYLASDLNYQTIGGLQHWSPRSFPTTVTVGSSQSGLTCPSNFYGNYIAYLSSIKLTWDIVPSADSYQIFKSFVSPNIENWNYLTIDVGNINEYMDTTLLPDQTYFYQILSKCGFVKSERSKTIMVTTGTLNVEKIEQLNKYNLGQNTPNPFNPITKISYSLPLDSQVSIVIYNLLGDKIKTLVNQAQLSGNHSISWDGTNDDGDQVVGGVYLYTIQAGEFNQTKKMVYIK